MTDREKLLPCPLCGKVPQILFVSSPLGSKWMLKCCLWHELTYYTESEKKELIKVWNTRDGGNK